MLFCEQRSWPLTTLNMETHSLRFQHATDISISYQNNCILKNKVNK